MTKFVRFTYPAMFAITLFVMGCPKKPLIIETPHGKVAVSDQGLSYKNKELGTEVALDKNSGFAVKSGIVPGLGVDARSSYKHTVIKGDTLWDIAGDKNTYDDPFLWPAIYKANRDQITDPDLIEIGWRVEFPRVLTLNERDQAHQKAYAEPEKHK